MCGSLTFHYAGFPHKSPLNISQTYDNVIYSKTPLLRLPLDLRKNGLYTGVVLLLS